MPDASHRVPTLSRNAGGREFKTAAELNAYITLAERERRDRRRAAAARRRDDARFSDGFDSLDLRLSRRFARHARR